MATDKWGSIEMGTFSNEAEEDSISRTENETKYIIVNESVVTNYNRFADAHDERFQKVLKFDEEFNKKFSSKRVYGFYSRPCTRDHMQSLGSIPPTDKHKVANVYSMNGSTVVIELERFGDAFDLYTAATYQPLRIIVSPPNLSIETEIEKILLEVKNKLEEAKKGAPPIPQERLEDPEKMLEKRLAELKQHEESRRAKRT